jgi:hypothetical protein
VRTSSQETWLSTRLSDPNATLWASITPPANPTLTTMIRRRAAAFSFDLLAHRLHLRFPETFSSRATARVGIFGAALALGAALSGLGYLEVTSSSRIATLQGARASASVASAAPHSATSTSFVRLGETAIDPVAPHRAPTLTATAPPAAVTEQVIQRLTPQVALADADPGTTAKTAKARAAAARKNAKSPARRPAKFRRALVAND